MGIISQRHPRLRIALLLVALSISQLQFCKAYAEVIALPVQRVIPTQPITKLEIVAMIKSMLRGRVLAVKKQSTYTNPDCHHVKFLEDKGEFYMIKIGCFADNFAKNRSYKK